MLRMMESFPVGRIGMMAGEDFSAEQVDQLIETANAGA